MTKLRSVQIKQGDFFATRDKSIVLSATLGSCVAACLFDPIRKIGGMNHFLLPDSGTTRAENNSRFGVHSMELLINEMITLGAHKSNMIAKAFGGGQVTKGFSNIGELNSNFILQFLAIEGIDCISHSLGSDKSRQIRFWPNSGEAKVKFLDHNVESITKPSHQLIGSHKNQGVTLF